MPNIKIPATDNSYCSLCFVT